MFSRGCAKSPDVADSLCSVAYISGIILHKTRKCNINYKLVLENKEQFNDNYRDKNG